MAKAYRLTKPAAMLLLIAVLAIAGTNIVLANDGHGREDRDQNRDRVLYIWAQDQAHVSPDFLAVIDFDERSAQYGKVINTVRLPPPGNIGNEPHHCHLNSTETVLACGGLLSLLKGQNGIFFFDVTAAKRPRFLYS